MSEAATEEKSGREEAEDLRDRLERLAESDLPFAEDAKRAIRRLENGN